MPRKVISSWQTTVDGLQEGEYKICVNDEEGTYEIETSNPILGIALGADTSGKQYTVIVRLMNPSPDTK